MHLFIVIVRTVELLLRDVDCLDFELMSANVGDEDLLSPRQKGTGRGSWPEEFLRTSVAALAPNEKVPHSFRPPLCHTYPSACEIIALQSVISED